MGGRVMVLGALLAAFALPSTAHAAGASPSAIDFGDVPINTTVTSDVTITVDAGYRTEIASGSGINAPFGFSFDTCGAGGGFTGPGTCTVKQRFTPTTTGTFNGSTNVFQCPVAGGTCIPITYTSTGRGISNASASPSAVDFGDVPINTTVTSDVTITVDAGYRTEIASGSGINAPFGFSFDTCGAGGGFTGPGTCTVKQRFTPTTTGTFNGSTNVFQCPVAGGTCIPITYTSTGRGISNASASPSAVDFGDVPINTTVTSDVTITVDAGYRTEIASGSGINAPFGFSFDTCGAGGGFTGPGTCTVKQRFTPTTTGTFNGSTNVFQCPVAGGTCIPITYTSTGRGISNASASPSAVDFGDVPINTTVTSDVTITVDAGYRTEIASGSGINAPFGFSFDTCGAGGGFTGPGTCTVKQRFTPTTTGTFNGSTNVFQCPVAGGTCIPITYTSTGRGAPVYTFGGFKSPLIPQPGLAQRKPGSAMPVSFELAGATGTDIFDPGYPVTTPIDCTTRLPIGASRPLAANEWVFQDLTRGVYHFKWKSQRDWRNVCQRLTLGFNDGSRHSADVHFK